MLNVWKPITNMEICYKLKKNETGLVVSGYLMEMRVELDKDNKYVGLKPKYEKEEVVIPSEHEYNGKTYPVTEIRKYTFSNLDNLASVIIPESVTKIGDWAFYNCQNL